MDKIQTKIILTRPIHEVGMKILEENIETIIIAGDDSPETILPLLDDKVSGVLIRNSVFNRAMIEKAVNLKVIARHGVGIELVDLDAATERGVMVVNSPGAATSSVAEHIVAFALVLSKKLNIAHKALRSGDFAIRHRYEPDDVEGKMIGFIGLGRIGQAAAQRCIGLGMRAIAYMPRKNQDLADRMGVRLCDTMEEVLRESDFVSLSTPLTPETKHMIGAEQLAMMRPTAYLINCSRGQVVDEEALIAALESGQIAGAGIDVFEEEPPRQDSKLFYMDNVIVTPHTAAMTKNGNMKMASIAAQQLVDVLRGNCPANLVNKAVLKK